jgi:hypothetical protein
VLTVHSAVLALVFVCLFVICSLPIALLLSSGPNR